MNITNIADIPTVSAKLANMRKPQEFIVANGKDGVLLKTGLVYIQQTGEGVLSTAGPYYVHLSGAPRYTFPKSFVEECMKVLA